MSTPFLSEIRVFSFDFAPKGWAMCNGQLLPINQNQPLFALLGTTYGGDGRTTFGLPDLRGRVPAHLGNGHTLGEHGGEESHTVIASEMPAHTHLVEGTSSPASSNLPTGNTFANSAGLPYSAAGTENATLSPASISSTGGSQPHENRQPYLVLTACIALQGIFPTQN